ncbi:MAG: hypothetical protein NVSMB45_18580 [Ginsengibacter sp.]
MGTTTLDEYSFAKTVAAANATVVWPEGKELYSLLPLIFLARFETGP